MAPPISRIIPLVLFGAIGVVTYLGLKNDPRLLPSQMIGKDVPKFDLPALATLPGIKSDEFKGKGLTLVNVFASWCVSCRVEHPLLMRVSNDKRFKLVGLDYKDTTPDANDYLAQFGNPYAQIGTDESGRTGIELGVYGVPETFAIDNLGRVRLRVPGPITPEIWTKDIEPLIKEAEKAS